MGHSVLLVAVVRESAVFTLGCAACGLVALSSSPSEVGISHRRWDRAEEAPGGWGPAQPRRLSQFPGVVLGLET